MVRMIPLKDYNLTPKNRKIINHLRTLNNYEKIKIQDTDKERLIFKNKDTWEIFGNKDIEILSPFNDYTYEWLNSFLNEVIDFIGYKDFDDFDELNNLIEEHIFEWADSETDLYTSNLTEWLNHTPRNIYYMDEVIEDKSENDGFKLLQLAQYKAIEELYNNALRVLINHLKEEFEEC